MHEMGRDKLPKFTFSIVDTVNLEHFIRIDSVDSEKSKFYMELISTHEETKKKKEDISFFLDRDARLPVRPKTHCTI